MNKYNFVQDFINVANEKNTTISEVMLEYTSKKMELEKTVILEQMLEQYTVMKDSISSGLEKNVKSVSGLTGGQAYIFKTFMDKNIGFLDSFISEIIYSALAVAELNACMGCIVAAPTAGSCGIIPACLVPLQKKYNFSDEKMVLGLINSGAIGEIIATNATISGAMGGCQAECGSASAMAASAVVEIMGGTPEMCGNAAAQAIKSQMGLVCDPVAGLVEEPCIIRNVSSAVIAMTSAQLALSGIKSIIPIDEVISAMDDVGKQLPPSLRETSTGGIAITPTAKEIEKSLFA